MRARTSIWVFVLHLVAACHAGDTAAQPARSPDYTAAGGQPLKGTYWKLVRLGDVPVVMAPNQKEPHLVLDPESDRVRGSGGCNLLVGTYQLDGDKLTFGTAATTMMACVQGMETESAFLKALEQVRKYKIEGNRLDLLSADGAAGHVVARFEAGQLQ